MLDPYRVEIPSGIFYADINVSSGTNTIITGVANKKIIVLSVSLVSSVQQNATFESSTGPVTMAGPYPCAQYGGVVLPHNAGGWFACALGDSLILALGSPAQVGGSISYVLAGIGGN